MTNNIHERRTHVKIRVTLGKRFAEARIIMRNAYGGDQWCLGRIKCHDRFKRFK